MAESALTVSGTRTAGLAALSSLVANGEGMYFSQRDILHGYFVLEP